MTYKGYRIDVACANKEDDICGDIYASLDECIKDHPGDEDSTVFGFCISADSNEHLCFDIPDWFETVEEAIAWIDEKED